MNSEKSKNKFKIHMQNNRVGKFVCIFGPRNLNPERQDQNARVGGRNSNVKGRQRLEIHGHLVLSRSDLGRAGTYSKKIRNFCTQAGS